MRRHFKWDYSALLVLKASDRWILSFHLACSTCGLVANSGAVTYPAALTADAFADRGQLGRGRSASYDFEEVWAVEHVITHSCSILQVVHTRWGHAGLAKFGGCRRVGARCSFKRDRAPFVEGRENQRN